MKEAEMSKKSVGFLLAVVGALALTATGSAGAQTVNVWTAGCQQVLTPDVITQLQAAKTDPLDDWYAFTQAHPNMIEVSMPIECRHEAWLVLHGRVPAPSTPTPEVPGSPLAPGIGANIDMAAGVSAYQGEVNIAVNPNNPLQIVGMANSFYRDPTAACLSPTGGSANTYGTQAAFGSTDGGATWVYNCAPWPPTLTGGVAGAVAWFGSDPAMVWDSLGNAYAIYMLINENTNGSAVGSAIVVAKSTNSGGSWANAGIVVNHETNSSLMDDKEMGAVDWTSAGAHSHLNRMYVIWDENNVERVAHADSPYTTWTTVAVDTAGDIGGNVAVGPDGTVYAAWNHYSTTGGVGAGDSLYVKVSTDGGGTWTAPHANPIQQHNLASFGTNNKPPAQNSRGINAFPIIDVDRNASSAYLGKVYIAYCDFPPATGSGSDLNVYLLNSANGGTSWSSQVLVNDDGGATSQFFPWMNVDQTDGTVNLGWYDTRNFSAANRKTQVFETRSINGGTSVEANVLVDDGGTNFVNKVNYSDENSTDNTLYNANQYGDYSGMWALNRQSHPMWTDSRDFYPTSGNANVEDAATATVTNCSAPTGVATPTLACSGGSIVVTWAAPASWGTNATGGTYTVTRYTDVACTLGATVLSTNATSPYTDSTGVSGTTYYYHITATNNCPGTALTPMSATSGCSAGLACSACSLAAPTGVVASSTADGQITVSWNTVTGATSYTVLRASGACPGSGYATLASGVISLSYVDNTATPGNTYSYEVEAVAGCTSPASACANATARGTYSSGLFVSGRPQDTTTAGLPVRWIFNTAASALTPPGLAPGSGGGAYAGTNDRYLHGMQNGQTATSGEWPSTWKPFIMNAPAQGRPPVVNTTLIGGHTRLIFTGSQDGHVYCVDANTGAMVWQSPPLGDYIQAAPDGIFSALGGSYNLILVGTRNSTSANVFYGLNAATGAIAWPFNNGGGANSIGIISGDAQVNYTGNQVYFTSRTYSGGSQQTVWCLSFTNLAAAPCSGFAPPTSIGNIDGGATLNNGVLYVGNNNGVVYALSPSTGAVNWSYTTGDGPIKGFITADFTVSPVRLYFSTNGNVWSLTDNGGTGTLNTGWPVSTIANPSIPLDLYGAGYILVGSSDGKLHQINATTPATQTSVTLGTGTAAVGSPTLDVPNSMVYVGTTGGDTYAATVPLP